MLQYHSSRLSPEVRNMANARGRVNRTSWRLRHVDLMLRRRCARGQQETVPPAFLASHAFEWVDSAVHS